MAGETFYVKELPRDGRELDLAGLRFAVYRRDDVGLQLVGAFRTAADATLFIGALGDMAGGEREDKPCIR